MSNANMNQLILQAERFQGSFSDGELEAAFLGVGLTQERKDAFLAQCANLESAKDRRELLLGQQKMATTNKNKARQVVLSKVTELAEVLRAYFPNAPWLSMIAFQRKYTSVPVLQESTDLSADEEQSEASGSEPESNESVRQIRRKSYSESELRDRLRRLSSNINALPEEALVTLGRFGFDESGLTELNALIDAFDAACSARNEAVLAYRDFLSDLRAQFDTLLREYRLYSKRLRKLAQANERIREKVNLIATRV